MVNPNVFSGQPRYSKDACSTMRDINALEAEIRFRYSRDWDTVGGPLGLFENPAGIVVFEEEVYVVDSIAKGVKVYDLKGTYKRTFSQSGFGELGQPTRILQTGGFLYVLDITQISLSLPDRDRIVKYSTAGNYQSHFVLNPIVGAPAPIGTHTSQPSDFVFLNDHFYTSHPGSGSSAGNDQVRKYYISGSLISIWSYSGTEDGEFNGPGALTEDGDGIYVTDTKIGTGQRIQEFSQSGGYRRAVIQLDSAIEGMSVLTSTIRGGFIFFPYGLFSEPTFSLSAWNLSDGTLKDRFGYFGTGDGQFFFVKDAFISQEEMFVTDSDTTFPFEIDPKVKVIALFVNKPTEFFAYPTETTNLSLGEPDDGVSIPENNALTVNEKNSLVTPQVIVDMREAVESLSTHYENTDTTERFNFRDLDAYSLYLEAMGDRTDYGATGGAKYDWTRTEAQMNGTPSMDIDIGEVFECVEVLKDSDPF